MNNEEKILGMLEQLTGDVAELKAIQAQQEKALARQGETLTAMNERLDELDDRSLRSAVMLENEIGPKVQLLYEGQALLKEKMDTLAPKNRVEILEDDMAMLKDVIKLMRQEINELKKAQ